MGKSFHLLLQAKISLAVEFGNLNFLLFGDLHTGKFTILQIDFGHIHHLPYLVFSQIGLSSPFQARQERQEHGYI